VIPTSELASARPFVLLLVVLMGIDLAMGLLCAFVSKKLSSSASWRGACKKAGTLLVVSVGVALDPFVSDIALGKVIALFYGVTEALSILENAGRLGIPLPSSLLEALSKLRGGAVEAREPHLPPS
jgi:toxin secretion/phage lysis holin